jgi:hypothetical protein
VTILGEFVYSIIEEAQFYAPFRHSDCYALILTKNRTGYVLGYFFANSSVHTGPDHVLARAAIARQELDKTFWLASKRSKI